MIRLVRPVFVLLMLGLLACSSTLRPIQIETGSKAEVTADGLHRIRNWRRDVVAYVKPGADFGHYDEILLELISISYRRPPRPGGGAGRDNFPLTDDQKKRLERIFREVFELELQRSEERTIATKAGPEVLRIDARLVDLVVSAPPSPVSARDNVYVSSTGAVTLVLDISDSQTGEMLARIAERGTAHQDGFSRNTPGANESNVRRLFRKWAATLAQRLDQAREFGPVPDVATDS